MDEADSVALFVIRVTSTRRFLARPAALEFLATGLSLPRPIRINLVRGNAVFLRQVLDNHVGPALAELVVVIRGTDRIGVAFDLDDVVLLAPHLLSKIIQSLLALARQFGY